jgi:hypothetical protein
VNSSSAILILGVEFAAVALFTFIAGASDDAGTIMVVFMIGLWLIYMVNDSKVIAGISNVIGNISSGQ